MLKNSVFVLWLGSFGALSGCADYLNHYDTVTLDAGNAQTHNRLLHTQEPFNPDSSNVTISTDGRRTADAQEVYQSSLKKLPPAQNTTLTIKAN